MFPLDEILRFVCLENFSADLFTEFDEEGEPIMEPIHFDIGETFVGTILDKWGNELDIQFEDGTMMMNIPQDLLKVID